MENFNIYWFLFFQVITLTLISLSLESYMLRSNGVKCAWCGKNIMVGMPVTLFTPAAKNFITPEHAVVYNKSPLQLVGCMRETCADTGLDVAGDLIFAGEVEKRQRASNKLLSGAGVVLQEL